LKIITYIPSGKFFIGNFFANYILANKSTRRSRGLLFDNNWSSDRIIYGCLSSLAKKFPILKFCTRAIRLTIQLAFSRPIRFTKLITDQYRPITFVLKKLPRKFSLVKINTKNFQQNVSTRIFYFLFY
jgi:hypothetical protein